MKRLNEYNELDGLRGLAILLVLFGHFSIVIDTNQLIADLAKKGVFIFFALSAYLLTDQFLNKYSFNYIDIKCYFIRRILRIYPLYLIVLLLLIFDKHFRSIMFGGQIYSFIDHLFLIKPIGNFWAISAEFEYYLVIPIISFIFLNISKKINYQMINIFIIFLFIIGCIYVHNIIVHKIYFYVNYPHLLPYLIVFIFGSTVALLHNLKNIKVESIKLDILIMILFLILFSGIPLFKETYIKNNIEFLYHIIASPIGCGSLSALIICFLKFSYFFKKLFSCDELRGIGKISFSLYLLHIFSYSIGSRIDLLVSNKYLFLSTVTVMSFIISSLSYVVIEKYFINLGYKITKR
jgi:peptidoglycan/LPS O-acetylase OafA/YrhL